MLGEGVHSVNSKIVTRPRRVVAGRRKTQKGAAIVESALVLLTLIGMIVFIMDMGRMLLTQQFITERVRTAARQAAVNNWTASQAQNFLVYNTSTAPAPVNGAAVSGYMGLVPSQVTYSTLGTSGTPDYRLQLKVSGVPVLSWIPHIAGQYTMPPIVATTPAQSLGSTN
jgi:Flp pilus assembly protein TadG